MDTLTILSNIALAIAIFAVGGVTLMVLGYLVARIVAWVMGSKWGE